MEIIEINTARYWELIDLEEKRKREGLPRPSVFLYPKTEEAKEYWELNNYRGMLQATGYFKNRKKYSELMEAYLKKKIGLGYFRGSFSQLWTKDRDQRKLLEAELKQNSVSTISVDSRARNFSALMGQLYSWNDNIDALLDEYHDNEELVEEKYLEEFQRIYLEMKELLSEN